LLAADAVAAESPAPQRTLKVCVAPDAPPPVRQAAGATLKATDHPLLRVLAEGRPPTALTDSRALAAVRPQERAFSHLILVGLPGDPLITAAWQREARTEDGGLYVFGFGHLRGTLGYVESDRNPFLHGAAIKAAPFETQVITLTGSTPEGVALAVDAFLRQGLVNGVVAGTGWTRPHTTLLDHDPLPAGFTAPAWLPRRAGTSPRLGVTQAGEDEYRGVLEDAGVAPAEIWRVKYYLPGCWDGGGAARAFDHYMAGLHRRAYGNTLWAARFASAAAAAHAAPRIAAAARLGKQGDLWTGAQPPYADGKYLGERRSPGPLSLWRRGEWLLMSTLPDAETRALHQATALGGK
jgi:hypothetical protein